MNELFDEPKPKICLEIEFDDHSILQNLAFSSKTEVLGGRATRVDFVGETFDALDFYRELLNEEYIAFLEAREGAMDEARGIINSVLKGLVEEIEFEEQLIRDEQEEIM